MDENAMHTDLILPLRPKLDAMATMESLDRCGLDDFEHLEFAAAQGWTIFTFDSGDFARLHWEWMTDRRTHAGIILETNSLLPIGELLRRFTRLLEDYATRPLADQLVYLGDYR